MIETEEIEYINDDNNDDNNAIEIVNTSNALEVQDNSEKSLIKKSFKEDFDYVRDNIKTVIDVGMTALQNVSRIAQESENARFYECLNELITNTTVNNAKLLEIYDSYEKLEQSSDENDNENKTKSITNNTLFIGTTTDLQKIIENRLKGR